MGADHTAAGELLADAADDFRLRRKEAPLCHPDCRARAEMTGEVERLREQLEKADRLAEVAGPAVECGRGEAGQCRRCAALDEALAAYEAAREGGNQ